MAKRVFVFSELENLLVFFTPGRSQIDSSIQFLIANGPHHAKFIKHILEAIEKPDDVILTITRNDAE